MNIDTTSPGHIFRRTIIIFGWLSVFFGTGIILILLYWLVWPYTPITFKDPVFPVFNTTVKAGTTLRYVSRYCKNTTESPVISRTFANDILFITPDTTGTRPVGCHEANIEVPVPQELPKGKYHLIVTYSYQVNPIRKIIIRMNTEEFTVLENGEVL